ncbi:hypothetical protein ACVWWK_000927 [Bradyrhizobium sp. LB9.1b]
MMMKIAGPSPEFDEGVVEAATVAGGRKRQEARIELALAAARAFAGKPAQRALQDSGLWLGRIGGLVHDEGVYHSSAETSGASKAKGRPCGRPF